MTTSRTCLALLLSLSALGAHAANTIDPQSSGATDVWKEFGSTLTMLTNPLDDPLYLGNTDLIVGDTAHAELRIDDGSEIITPQAYIARQAGSMGVVTVEGPGSMLSMQYPFHVGGFGDGTLNVLGGATISSIASTRDGAVIGAEPGSTGALNVDGIGSAATLSSSLVVGPVGDGTLDITGGATVTSTGGYVATLANSTGVVTVDGEGSTWTNTGPLTVAIEGQGTLRISQGGHVTASSTYVSTRGGVGTIEFDDAALTTGMLYASPNQLPGVGTIHATGLISDMDLVFDAAHGLEQTLHIDELPGQDITLHLNATGLNDMGAGYKSTGSLQIADGIQLASGTGYIGYFAGAMGNVTIDGDGSEWNLSSSLNVGYDGDGALLVTGGASVAGEGSGIYIADRQASSGVVTVEGAGSTLSSGSVLRVGDSGEGELHILNGGVVSSPTSYLGYLGGSAGAVTVDGSGSTFVSQSLNVGGKGSASMLVTGGANVECTYGQLGAAASGQVVIDGPGSSFHIEETLIVAFNGPGVLTISAGAEVTAKALTIDYDLGSDGRLRMSTGGRLLLQGNADDSLTEFFDLIGGTDAIEYWDTSTAEWEPLTSATLGDDYTLEFLTTGQLAGYTLLTVGQLPAVTGDYNGDGVVSAADYTLWRNHLGGDAAAVFADGSRAAGLTGAIGPDDYQVWKQNFGARASALPAPLAATTVPEPASLWLVVAVAVCLTVTISRRFEGT